MSEMELTILGTRTITRKDFKEIFNGTPRVITFDQLLVLLGVNKKEIKNMVAIEIEGPTFLIETKESEDD